MIQKNMLCVQDESEVRTIPVKPLMDKYRQMISYIDLQKSTKIVTKSS